MNNKIKENKMEVKVRLYKDGEFPINEELASIVPMATDQEQEALTADIKENGQLQPITLWRGEIVDGRCRQKALRMLKQAIAYVELDKELTKEEVEVYVKSVNTRRNLTMAQKAMIAAKESFKKNNKYTINQLAKAWGVSDKLVKNAKYIWKQDKEIAQNLFDGKAVTIINKDGEETTSSKITTVYAYLKRIEENIANSEEQHAWNANSYIKTQKAKEWFYKMLKTIGKTPINSPEGQKILADLANYKFPKYNKDFENADNEKLQEVNKIHNDIVSNLSDEQISYLIKILTKNI